MAYMTCFECGTRIKFDSTILSPKGRSIPLEMDGSLHDCVSKPSFTENFDLPSNQYVKRRQQSPTAETPAAITTATATTEPYTRRYQRKNRQYGNRAGISSRHDKGIGQTNQ